jgi:hypothetical protein
MSSNETLEKLKLWVQIVSTIAVPVVVFIVGHQVQQTIADQELGKSYVQMAIDVLKASPTPETVELRQWAVATVDKHSPIPLSKELREQLRKGKVELKAAAVERGTEQRADTPGGIVKYLKCEKVLDAETAQWMVKNIPEHFQKCPSADEVGVTKFKRRDGPLKEGEVLLSYSEFKEVPDTQLDIEQSVNCLKMRDKETAEWLLKQYGKIVYKCPKQNEVGVESIKIRKKEHSPDRQSR